MLISSQFLRQFQCGQVDLSYMQNGELNLVEIKSSDIGVKQMQRNQKKRLCRGALLLESLLDIPVNLKIIAKR